MDAETVEAQGASLGVTTLPREEFEVNPMATIGLEMELFVRDQNLDPAGEAAKELAAQTRRCLVDNYCIGPELPIDMLEVRTTPHSSLDNLLMDMHTTLSVLTEEAEDEGLLVLPMSLDPTAEVINLDWSDERVREIVANMFGVGILEMSCIGSLQINVQVGDGNAALFVHQALRRAAHCLVALTANSPFYRGKPNGLLAMRPALKALVPDGGWVAEEIPERTWEEYYRNRIKMCGIGSTMPSPWFHHLPLRIRPDRNMCIEFACLEVVPDMRMIIALSDFLRRLVTRLCMAYRKRELLPKSCFGPKQQMGLRKCMLEAMLHGRNGTFLDAGICAVPARKMIEELIAYAGEAPGDVSHDWNLTLDILRDVLENGTPAEKLLRRFREWHCCSVPGCGCPDSTNVVKAIAEETAWRFHGQFKE